MKKWKNEKINKGKSLGKGRREEKRRRKDRIPNKKTKPRKCRKNSWGRKNSLGSRETHKGVFYLVGWHGGASKVERKGSSRVLFSPHPFFFF
jgi:hypothetical protein